MKTRCSGGPLEFHPWDGVQRPVDSMAGRMSSDAGGVLLRDVDKRTGVTERVSNGKRHDSVAQFKHSVLAFCTPQNHGGAGTIMPAPIGRVFRSA